MEVWRAIPDVLGRRLSEAKSAEGGGRTPLLATKYEPDVVKTDRDNDVTKWQLSILALSAKLVTSLWAAGESYPLPVFGFR